MVFFPREARDSNSRSHTKNRARLGPTTSSRRTTQARPDRTKRTDQTSKTSRLFIASAHPFQQWCFKTSTMEALDWKHWVSAFKIYAVASRLTEKDDKVQRAPMLHCLGQYNESSIHSQATQNIRRCENRSGRILRAKTKCCSRTL